MRRTAAGFVVALGAAVAASCGPPQTPKDVAPAAGDAAQDEAQRRPAPRAAKDDAPAIDPAVAADVDALVACWDAAADAAERRRVEARIVALGRPALDRLLARIAAAEGDDTAETCIVARFGADAVEPVLALLATASGPVREALVRILERTAPAWRDDPRGEAVCRALVTLLADDDVGYSAAANVLAASRPAGRAVAKDLAALWLHGSRETAARAESALTGLCSDAAPAARDLAAAAVDLAAKAALEGEPSEQGDDAEAPPTAQERCLGALCVLQAIGSADPAVLPDLRRILASGAPSDVRRRIGWVLCAWGDAGAAAGPELLAALRDPDREVRETAAYALVAMPSQVDRVLVEVRAACDRGDAWTREGDVVLDVFADAPALAERLAGLLPTLPADCTAAFVRALAEHGGFEVSRISPSLVACPDPEVRRIAIYEWDDDCPAPDAAAWLADPDPSVRAVAARALAECFGAPATTVRDPALALLHADDAEVRTDAVAALAPYVRDDSAALAAVVAALDGDPDDGVRRAAAAALSADDRAIDGDHAAAVAWLAARLQDEASGVRSELDSAIDLPRVLLRLRGGDAALVAAVTAALATPDGTKSYHLRTSVDAVIDAGPRAAALRPALVALRASHSGSEARLLDAAIAAIDGDADALALCGDVRAAVFRRLLSMGAAGRRAAVVLAGSPDGGPNLESLRGARIDAEIAEAARAAPPDPLAGRRRLGAARLARLLPTEAAVALLANLVGDASRPPSAAIAYAAADGALEIEGAAPGTVPVALAERLLAARPSPDIEIGLAEVLGPRGAPLVPALRRLRDADDRAVSGRAAVALWRITRDADEALPALRRVLAEQDVADLLLDWSNIGAALGEMPLGKPDLDLVFTILRRDDDEGALTAALVPLLEWFGPDAAPAVPALRRRVADRDCEGGYAEGTAAAAVRVLGAIGAAARPAVPDIRMWAAWTHDRDGVGREAIRRIESATR